MIEVLIVDDSTTLRRLLERLLTEDPDIRVVGRVFSGEEALRFLERRSVDVVTMDIELSGLDGFETTRRIMASRPCPVVIVSSRWDPSEVEKTFLAVDAGAVALLPKPGAGEDPKLYGGELRRVVREAALAGPPKRRRRPPASQRRSAPAAEGRPSVPLRVVVVGASTGGPQALAELLAGLPGDFPLPLLVVQHIAFGFLGGLADWLSKVTSLSVKIAEEGPVEGGTVYLGPEGRHLEMTDCATLKLTEAPPEHAVRPSASRLFRSVASVCASSSAAVLLSGMGTDGAAELRRLRDLGAVTFAQDRESSIVWGMPGEAVRLDGAGQVLSPSLIASALVDLVGRRGTKGGTMRKGRER